MPSWRSREMRLRSPSMARARRWRRRKTFSSEGPMWREMRSSQARSGRSKGLRPLIKNRRAGGGEAAAVAAVPAKAAAGALEAIPADGGVHIVEEEAVGAG